MNKIAKDFFGREIKLNDLCIYPVRRSSKMWLNKVTVTNIVQDALGNFKISGPNQNSYPVHVSALDRVVIVGRDNTLPMLED